MYDMAAVAVTGSGQWSYLVAAPFTVNGVLALKREHTFDYSCHTMTSQKPFLASLFFPGEVKLFELTERPV